MNNRKIPIAALLLGFAGLSSQASTLSFSVSGEVTELEITHCRTDSYKSGQLLVEAELTAVGTFRGRPATLLMAKGSGSTSDYLDLHLIEIAPELRTASPLDASNRITMDQVNQLRQREAEASAELDLEALEKLPPEEMAVEMEAAFKAQREGMDAAEAEIDAQFAKVRSFGDIKVDGSAIAFEGSDTRVIRGENEEAFASIAGQELRVSAKCES
ncbi:MAG: hypothetical protein WBP34_18505 [Thermoanaerobaculia bacterium]